MDRLEQARELALALGALATVAVLDVQIAAALAIGDDPEPGLVVARRAAELARRYRLGAPLAAALAFEALAHARAGRRTELERCLAEASEHGDGDFDVIAEFARALLAFVEEDRAAARRHLERAAVALPQASGDQATGPAAGLLALVLAVDGDDAGMARWPAHEPVHFLARGFLRYAEAVSPAGPGDVDAALGACSPRATRRWRACRGSGTAAGAWSPRPRWPTGGATRWRWLTDALAFFDRNGDDRIASACRSLLRKAGAPVPRRRAEEAASAGVTAGAGRHRPRARGAPPARRGAVQQGDRRPPVPFAPHGRAPRRQPHRQGRRGAACGAGRLRRPDRRP